MVVRAKVLIRYQPDFFQASTGWQEAICFIE